jgi:hypothetical protein
MTDVPSYKPRETSFPKKRWLYYQMEEKLLGREEHRQLSKLAI